jgi:hypothetical protein
MLPRIRKISDAVQLRGLLEKILRDGDDLRAVLDHLERLTGLREKAGA